MGHGSGFYTKGNEWSCTQVQSQFPGKGLTVQFANPISVAWQSSDLAHFTPASAPVRALARQTLGTLADTKTAKAVNLDGHAVTAVEAGGSGVPAISNGRPAGTAHRTGSTREGLSAGAAAGIGVGATLVGIAIIGGLLFWFFRRYKLISRNPKKKGRHEDEKGDVYEVEGSGGQGRRDLKRRAEPDPENHVLEAADTGKPHEADSRSIRLELEGDLRKDTKWPSVDVISGAPSESTNER